MTEAEKLAAHLRDLAPEDLPDSQRETTLNSIAAFRERSMKKQTERRELDRQIEERRQAMIQKRTREQQQQQQQRSSVSASTTTPAVDPQSFNQPIGFVAQGGEQTHTGEGVEPEIDDAKRERERAEQEHRQQENIFKDVSFLSLFSITGVFVIVTDVSCGGIEGTKIRTTREREDSSLGKGENEGTIDR